MRSKLARLKIIHVAVGLLLLGVAARTVRYLLNFPLWGDEAFVAVDFLIRDFAGMIRPLTYGQIVPLGYMWTTLALSKVLGASEMALRLPAYASGLVGLLLFWFFASRTVSRTAAALAVAFLSLAYYPIRHAAEVKPYSTDLLVAIVFLMLAWAVHVHPRSVARWIALILFAPAAIWCSYPAVFIGGAAAMLLIGSAAIRAHAEQPRLPIGRIFPATGWLAFTVVLAGTFAWMYLVYGRPHAQVADRMADTEMWAKTFPPLARPWKLPLWLVQIHTGNMFAYPMGGKNGGSIITLACCVAGAVRLWKKNRALLVLLLAPFPLNLVAAALEKYPYGGTVRSSIFLAPSICLLAGVGLAVLLRVAANALHRRRERQTLRARASLPAAAAGVQPVAVDYAPAPREASPLRVFFGLLRSAAVNPSLTRRLVLTGVGVFAAIGLGNMVRDLTRPYKKEANYRSREAIAAVAAQSTPADQWIVFNAIEPVPHAPYIAAWKGDGAQFIYYAMRLSPAPIRWSPPPDQVSAASGGKTWLLAFHGANFPFSQEQFEAYLAKLQSRLASPRKHSFVLQRYGDLQWQVIDAYEFPPADLAGARD